MNNPFREPSPPPLSTVLELWSAGRDTSQIARMYGVREAVVYNMLAHAKSEAA